MRSLTRLPRSLRTNKVAAWGGCSCTGRAPGANRLGNCAPRKIGASWTWKVFIKGLKTLPIMPVDRCGGLAGPTGRFYRNPAKTHVFTDSCSEPFFRGHIFCYAPSYARTRVRVRHSVKNLTFCWLVFHLEPALPGRSKHTFHRQYYRLLQSCSTGTSIARLPGGPT